MAGSQTTGSLDSFDFGAVGETITSRFATASRTAGATVAIIEGSESLTYAELDRRSNQLARFLLRRGVGAGSAVALHAGRSLGSLVAIVATLKIRAAYVPLDPVSPIAYLEPMVRDCGARLVLSASDGISAFPTETIGLDEALALARDEADTPLEDLARPTDIAYVMYTSGSTGRPKGVRIPHRAVVRLVVDQEYAHFGADEVILFNSPLAFDASTFEIWGALLHGARGVLVSDDRPSLQAIAETIRQHGVTTAWFTAGLFHALMDHQLDALSGLRQLLAGGDVLSPSHVTRALAALPDCQLINGYGPTENTTFTCCYRIPRDGWGDGPVPIGKPIGGTYVRLLDDDMHPVREGEIGMLYAGGLGLASGYVGDPLRTAEQFVADPQHAGTMLYRTGDLARRRPDGNIDFIGRHDRQVKIDGKRVEFGEIEEVLRHSGQVGDAVVSATRNDTGAPVLTAHVTPPPGSRDHAAVMASTRASLAQALPTYMRPSRIVVLDEFPLTTNGKIDRARLSALKAIESTPMPSAKNETQRLLEELFGRVLGVPHVGLDTNFFDLGATSLKLIEAHAAIARLWPDIDVVTLFRHPNLRELARAIDGAGRPVVGAAKHRAQQQAGALKRLRAARHTR